MMARYGGNPGVLSHEFHQVCGIQRGIRIAAMNHGKPPPKRALQNRFNRTATILEYVVMNDYISGAHHGHGYVHNDPPL